MEEIQSLLNLTLYTNRDNCRTTITLRNHEQGYMNGRMISLNKQLKFRDEVLDENQVDTKLSDPIYRLLLAKDTKLQELTRRLKSSFAKLSPSSNP